MERQEQAGQDGHPWAEQDLFLWLLRLQTQAEPSRSAESRAGGPHMARSKPKHHIQLVLAPEILAYLPTSSPLTILQIAPTPTYTLLTSLSLSTHLLTDTTITSLRNLPYLFFLVLQACPGVTDAGIKSLAMSLDYNQAILSAGPGDKEGRGRGCWRLRGIWLDGCKRVTDNAVRDLVKWPLLNVLCQLFRAVACLSSLLPRLYRLMCSSRQHGYQGSTSLSPRLALVPGDFVGCCFFNPPGRFSLPLRDFRPSDQQEVSSLPR